MRVEVVYALALEQDCSVLDLPEGANVGEAIERSGVLVRHPELDRDTVRCGVWARRCSPETVLHDGDRVEIYRPLQADAHEARRRRVRKKQGHSP